MTTGRRAAAAALLVAALGLAVGGQFYFFRRREFLWDGVVLHLLAAVCFLLAWHVMQSRPTEPAAARAGRWRVGVPAGLLAGGVLCTAVATLLVRDRRWDQATGDAVLIWLVGVGLAILAAIWPAPGGRLRLPSLPAMRQQAGRLARTEWLEIAAVAGMTIAGLLLRTVALGSVPYTLGGDEAWHGLLARQVMHSEMRNPFIMGYMSMPTLFYWPVSWSLWLVEDGIIGLRLPAALAGTATIPLFYAFTRSLWGRRPALLSTVFLTAYDYHIHYSRLGANNIWDPLFVIVAVWGIDRALTADREDGAPRIKPLIVAGLALGVGFYFYTGARLLPLLIVAYAGFVWITSRSPRGSTGHPLTLGQVVQALAVVGVAAIIVAGPMISFALAHPDDWNARVNQIGIIQSGWLEREPELTGKTPARLLTEQFLHAAGAFHVYADKTMWYGSERPLLGFLAGAFALLGMAWAVAHWRERRHFLVLIWFWSVIITGGMLTDSPPSSQRLVMAIPAVCLLVTIGAEQTVALGRRLLGSSRRAENLALGLIMAALAVSSIRYYFVEFIPTGRYGSQNGETATMMGYALRELPPGTCVYFFGAPRMYWSFGTMGFMAPQVEGLDVNDPLTDLAAAASLPPAEDGRPIAFFFLPERSGELTWVQTAFPDGQVREVRDGQGQLRFITYNPPN